MADHTCNTCPSCDVAGCSDGVGYCRVSPPTVSVGIGELADEPGASWPLVKVDEDWCAYHPERTVENSKLLAELSAEAFDYD